MCVILIIHVFVYISLPLKTGGTGDLAAMFQDLLSVFPSSRFVAVGFSLGGNILVRFMGEREEWRKHFVCAISVGQGYDPNW